MLGSYRHLRHLDRGRKRRRERRPPHVRCHALTSLSPHTVKVDFETTSGGTATEGVDYYARRTSTPTSFRMERQDHADGLRAH